MVILLETLEEGNTNEAVTLFLFYKNMFYANVCCQN